MKTIKMILGIAVVATLSTSVYGVCTSQVHMSGNKIIDLGDPIYPQDAATKKYVDARVAVARAAIEAEKERKRKEDLNTPTGYKVINYGGKAWLDRNIGATSAATSYNDTTQTSLGSLFQWGRPKDGHQKRNSPLGGACSDSDIPWFLNFVIKSQLSGGYNWRTNASDCGVDAQRTDLWSAPGAANNGVCPAGWRVPSEENFKALNLTSVRDAFTKIKLSAAGYRSNSNGNISNVGTGGHYWTSSIDGDKSRSLSIYSGGTGFSSDSRAYGFSVRCVKHLGN